MFDLTGKVAIVTGGAGVLGSAMAHGLADAGAKIGILSRTQSKVNATVQALQHNGAEAISLIADVLNKEQLDAAKQVVLDKWGKVDILVNCAGGNMKGATIMPDQNFFDLSIDDFSKVTDLNLKGTVLPTIVFGKVMADQNNGSIVNISSMAAQSAITRVLGYSASKAAVDNFTKWMAVELAHKRQN